ncbi:hypothetical protein LEP1GSC188_4527 [Leptospira weilii serovar Topaz str. LT2116]|uniref:Uncharacterized protein n=1 Tax=Leptospira weilii serovar Topaz str. LT2116 TaxID=1088540 RepID=M3H362_9LEPT|nr:hypothetical protein LEP1GSC188_4527 [Leptospira weilii serovar Topaz str. LT2116]
MSGSSSNQEKEKREKIKSILKQAGIGLLIGLITASLIRFFLFFRSHWKRKKCFLPIPLEKEFTFPVL